MLKGGQQTKLSLQIYLLWLTLIFYKNLNLNFMKLSSLQQSPLFPVFSYLPCFFRLPFWPLKAFGFWLLRICILSPSWDNVAHLPSFSVPLTTSQVTSSSQAHPLLLLLFSFPFKKNFLQGYLSFSQIFLIFFPLLFSLISTGYDSSWYPLRRGNNTVTLRTKKGSKNRYH